MKHRRFFCAIILIISYSLARGASVPESSLNTKKLDDLHFDELSQEDASAEFEVPSLGEMAIRKYRTSVQPITCTGHGHFAIPDQCVEFFTCQGEEEFATLNKCPAGKFFHHQMRLCAKMTLTECRQTMCQSTTQKFADPSSKDSYLSCEKMYPEVNKCPHDQKFNPTTLNCEGEGSPETKIKRELEDADVE